MIFEGIQSKIKTKNNFIVFRIYKFPGKSLKRTFCRKRLTLNYLQTNYRQDPGLCTACICPHSQDESEASEKERYM